MTFFLSSRLRQLVSVFVIALAASGLAGCQQSSDGRETEPSPVPTPLPYEDKILYLSSGQFYLTTLAGDQVEKIPFPGRSNWFPAVSPDDTRLAYWSTQSGFHEVWLYHLEQEKVRQLTFFNEKLADVTLQNFNVHNAPTWSPDGKRIIFSLAGKIWTVDAEGFNLETLVSEGWNYSPALSPDGKLLAYVLDRNKSRNLALRTFDSGEVRSLTKFPVTHQVGGPAWSPDGKTLAFTVSVFDKVDIWKADRDGSHLQRLTRDGHSNSPSCRRRWPSAGRAVPGRRPP